MIAPIEIVFGLEDANHGRKVSCALIGGEGLPKKIQIDSWPILRFQTPQAVDRPAP
jgi:hypothetical protein